MPWELTGDVEVYAERAWPLLCRDPAANTVALTVIEDLRRGRRFDGPSTFGWLEDGGGVQGAVSLNPPYELQLAQAPIGSLPALADALRVRGIAVPGVNGDPELVHAFADAWTAGTDLPQRVAMRQWLYRLGTLVPPDPTPPGRARPARDDEAAALVAFLLAFQDEAGAHGTDPHAWVPATMADGRLWVWEDADGALATLAGRSPTAARVARIAPVYTPPEHRRRGYGAAVTAACAADALARDADHVVLHTDRSNPTANGVYRRIGFDVIAERDLIRFD